MKEYTIQQIRNVALIGHGSSGKTLFIESALVAGGAIDRPGKIQEGSTVTDFDDEEIRRGISLSTALAPVEWRKYKINLLDTPGYTDFVGEVKSALRVSELALTVIDAASGVEVGTELTWNYAEEAQLPHAVIINKMDRENASFERSLDSLERAFDAQFAPVLLPIGAEGDFKGVVNVLEKQAYLGPEGKRGDIPADMVERVEELNFELMESAAEGDDELLMKYLEGEELTADEIMSGLRQAVADGSLVPVMAASGETAFGVSAILDLLAKVGPSPADVGLVAVNDESFPVSDESPLALLVFKTMADPYVGKLTYFRVYGGVAESGSTFYIPRVDEGDRVSQLLVMRGKNQIEVDKLHAGDIGAATKMGNALTGDTLCDGGYVVELPGPDFPDPLYSVAVYPESKSDTAKMGSTLTRMCEEDPTLHWRHDPSTNETILSGMGDAHVDTAVRRIQGRFGVNLGMRIPKVPYKETITRTASSQYRHKKQSGGAGQFAEVHMRLEPQPRDEGFEYVWEVYGGHISSSFEPSIEKGVKSVMKKGVIAGYSIVDVLVAVYDGKEHPVDSKDIAFQIAGREAFKEAFLQAGPVLLEPMYLFTITAPDEFTGDVISDLNSRRARVQGMDQRNSKSIITAEGPLAEMQQYATNLRALTQGRGVYSMEFSHYAIVPTHLAQEIIAASKAEKE
jgi:elongation factor G